MKKNEELFQYFAPLYILNKLYGNKGLTNPENFKEDEQFLAEIKKLQNQDESLISEISQAINDDTDKFDQIWTKAEELSKASNVMSAEKGAKLEYLKSLNSYKKGKKMARKCKCGCDMIDVKEEGGKITSKCSCNCGGGKIKIKEKGGILDKVDLYSLVDSGVIDASIENKWERRMNSKKLGKFKK